LAGHLVELRLSSTIPVTSEGPVARRIKMIRSITRSLSLSLLISVSCIAEAALRTAGVANDVHIYDEVKHGFWLHVDRDPETNQEPALNAWTRLKAHLKRTIQ